MENRLEKWKKYVSFGWTLTGCDFAEPRASTNAERIKAMRELHEAGFKTFVSAEPIIDFKNTFDMIDKAWDYCNLFKIGLLSGKKCDKSEVNRFISRLTSYRAKRAIPTCHIAKIYLKDGLLEQSDYTREELPRNFVCKNFNIWENE